MSNSGEPVRALPARYWVTFTSEAPLMPMNYQSRRYALLHSPVDVNLQIRRVRKYLRPRATDRILDVGCGRGYLTQQLQHFVPATTGIDLNAHAVANGVTRNLRIMDAQKLEFPDASFDKIYSSHAIEHIPDLVGAFEEMDRVLRPGGTMLLVYPAEPIRGLYVVPTAIILFGNPLRARDIHLRRLSPWSLPRYLAGTSLRIVHRALHLIPTPQFSTVLVKGDRLVKAA